MDKILKNSKDFYDNIKDLKYPESFEISPWWKIRVEWMKNIIKNSSFFEDTIVKGQTKIPFDHRRPYNNDIIYRKLSLLKDFFGELPEIYDSKYSMYVIDGYSNIFLWHLYFYLKCNKYCNNIKSILEIGSGYGGLARIFKLADNKIKYTLIDLPESLFFAHVYLNANFSENDFIYIPIQQMSKLYNEHYDLIINTASFQETPVKTLNYFMDFINNKINVNMFYSCNYKKGCSSHPEAGNDNPLLITNNWEIIYEEENNPILKVDSDREWYEVIFKNNNI